MFRWFEIVRFQSRETRHQLYVLSLFLPIFAINHICLIIDICCVFSHIFRKNMTPLINLFPSNCFLHFNRSTGVPSACGLLKKSKLSQLEQSGTLSWLLNRRERVPDDALIGLSTSPYRYVGHSCSTKEQTIISVLPFKNFQKRNKHPCFSYNYILLESCL